MNGNGKSFYKKEFKEHPINQWKDKFSAFFTEAAEWAKKRFPWLRLVLLVYFLFVLINHIRDPFYQSWFKPLNLGIHELGHLLFRPLGQFMMIAGGTIFQFLVPVISFFMFYRQRDFFALSISFCWLGTNFFDTATYVADARQMALPLVTPFGGPEIIHDWNYLLGKLGLLNMDTSLAFIVKLLGIVSLLVGLVFGTWLIFLMFRKD